MTAPAQTHEPPKALRASDLIFPAAAEPVAKTLGRLKRDVLSLSNRLASVARDAAFVSRQAAQLRGLPVIANERCGSWYVDPALKAASAYFKSTDGHFGQWSFSLRRLNLQVLGLIGDAGGAVIVDSTRQGKDMPDAFSRTIPIWCAVINRLLFAEHPHSQHLSTPLEIISDSEHAQIDDRLDGFVAAARTLSLDLDSLRDRLKKPIELQWFSQSREFTPSHDSDLADDLNVLHLCMASYVCHVGTPDSYTGYIQGSGDDAEMWGLGITPRAFWRFKDCLLQANDDELPALIYECIGLEKEEQASSAAAVVQRAPWLSIGRMQSGSDLEISGASNVGLVICCCERLPEALNQTTRKGLLHMKCRTGKLGSRDLRKELDKLPSFMSSNSKAERAAVYCATGTDLSIGVSLTLLCRYCNEDGMLVAPDRVRNALALLTSGQDH